MTPTDLHRIPEIMDRDEGRGWEMDHESTKQILESPPLWLVIVCLALVCALSIILHEGGFL